MIIRAIKNWIASIRSTTGAEAVRNAIEEVEEVYDDNYTGTFGEPGVLENGGEHFNKPMVEVPIRNLPFADNQSLYFELPEGRADETSDFLELIDKFDFGFDDFDQLEGSEVSVKMEGGNIVIDWRAFSKESSGNGGETDTEAVEVEENEDEDEDEEDDGKSGITVEEETISGDRSAA